MMIEMRLLCEDEFTSYGCVVEVGSNGCSVKYN